MLDVIKGYLQLAEGLGDVALQRIRDLSDSLTSQGMEATAKSTEQVQNLTEDLMEQGRTNMDLLTGVVRTEVDRAVGRLGFVRQEELAAVRGHVKRLEDQLRREHQKATDRATGAVMTAADMSQTAAKSAVEAATGAVAGVTEVAKGVMARGAGDEPAPAPKPAAAPAAKRATPAEAAPAAKRATAKKAPAKPAAKTTASESTGTAAKKTTTRKSPARKTAAKTTPATPSEA